jgi:glycosyltransferase involved in cell wall biosynthesis
MKKKILVISPVPTHPLNAGNRARIHRLLLNLEEMKHEVHFLHVKREPGDDEQMRKFLGSKFHSFPYDISQIKIDFTGRIKRKLAWTFKNRHIFCYAIDDWYDRSLNEFLAKLAREISFDVVIVEYVFFSRALQCFGKNVLKIIDTHDVFTDRHRLFLNSGQQPKWYSTTAKEEAKGLQRADVIIAIKPQEKKFFSKLVDKKIITMGHAVALHKPAPGRQTSKKKRILFVGSTNSFNIHGINLFISDIFPRVKSFYPNLELMLAGKVCKAVDDFEGCIKLGEVDDIKTAYDGADMVINPVRFGTGQCIKTIEALGYSKPVVTTSTGAEGLEDGMNKAFLVANDSEGFAKSILTILSDATFYNQLSQTAYDFAKKWNEENLSELAGILNHGSHVM